MKTLLISILILLTVFNLNAQIPEINTAFIKWDTTNVSSDFTGTIIIELNSVTGINSIDVEIGSEEGASDWFNYSFTFDVTQGLPTGTSYLRDGNKIYLTIGTYTLNNMYYGKIQLLTNSGPGSEYLIAGN